MICITCQSIGSPFLFHTNISDITMLPSTAEDNSTIHYTLNKIFCLFIFDIQAALKMLLIFVRKILDVHFIKSKKQKNRQTNTPCTGAEIPLFVNPCKSMCRIHLVGVYIDLFPLNFSVSFTYLFIFLFNKFLFLIFLFSNSYAELDGIHKSES